MSEIHTSQIYNTDTRTIHPSKVWGIKETYDLIKGYEIYPELWNSNRKVLYRDRDKKSLALIKLARAHSCSAHEIQRKLHNLRSQVAQEIQKIAKKSTEYASDEVQPTSKWPYFNALKFVANVIQSSKPETSQSFLVNQEIIYPEIKDPELVSAINNRSINDKVEQTVADIYHETASPSHHKRGSTFSSPEETSVHSKPLHKKKRKKLKISSVSMIQSSYGVARKSTQEAIVLDQFGKYVVAELRGLPLREGTLLQQEIQNSITKAKLSCIPSVITNSKAIITNSKATISTTKNLSHRSSGLVSSTPVDNNYSCSADSDDYYSEYV